MIMSKSNKFLAVLLAMTLSFGTLGSLAVYAEGESTPDANSQQNTSSVVSSVSNENQEAMPAEENNIVALEAESGGSSSENSGNSGTSTPENTGELYVSNYRVLDSLGNPLTKVVPGDKVIVVAYMVDSRIDRSLFNIGDGVITPRVHTTMSQGAFTIGSNDDIVARVKSPVNGKFCYALEFRNVTYVGGSQDFGFTVSYTGSNDNGNTDNNMPIGVPQVTNTMAISQAVDDVAAPTIILNSANYGKTVNAGDKFTLATSAVNTSSNLDLENVSVKIVLPTGLSMASGNTQVLIGSVGKNGTINHNFSLVADNIQGENATLPVSLVYTFEAFVGGKRQQFTSEQQVSVNVQQPIRFSMNDFSASDSFYQTETGNVSFSLVNKGKSAVYNVQVELISEDFTGADVEFIGNIDSGSSKSVDIDYNATKVGTGKGKIVVSYEDSAGKVTTIEKEFTSEVTEYVQPDSPDIAPVEPEDEKPSVVPYVIGGIGIVGAVAAFVIIKKKKARRAAELEDEDEDI